MTKKYSVTLHDMQAKFEKLSANAYKLSRMLWDRAFKNNGSTQGHITVKWETLYQLTGKGTRKTVNKYLEDMKRMNVANIIKNEFQVHIFFFASVENLSPGWEKVFQHRGEQGGKKNSLQKGCNPSNLVAPVNPCSNNISVSVSSLNKYTNTNTNNNTQIEIGFLDKTAEDSKVVQTEEDLSERLKCMINFISDQIWKKLSAMQKDSKDRSTFMYDTLKYEITKYAKKEKYTETEMANAFFAVMEKTRINKSALALVRGIFGKKMKPYYICDPININLGQAIHNSLETGLESMSELLSGQGFGKVFSKEPRQIEKLALMFLGEKATSSEQQISVDVNAAVISSTPVTCFSPDQSLTGRSANEITRVVNDIMKCGHNNIHVNKEKIIIEVEGLLDLYQKRLKMLKEALVVISDVSFCIKIRLKSKTFSSATGTI